MPDYFLADVQNGGLRKNPFFGKKFKKPIADSEVIIDRSKNGWMEKLMVSDRRSGITKKENESFGG